MTIIEIIYLFIVTLHYTTLKLLICVDTRVIQSLPQCMPAIVKLNA